jgi:general secretion pathway protein H
MKHRRSRTGDRGFTLLELLVVLTVAGLLVTIAGPRLNDSVARARLQASGGRLAAILRRVRADAIRTAEPADVSIAADHQHYRAQGRDFALASGQNLILADSGEADADGVAHLRFFPDGSSSGGNLTITGGNRRTSVAVDWLSGRVTIGESR